MWEWLKRLFGVNKQILHGDGTWPFSAYVDGEDIRCDDIVMTAFGGFGKGRISDPQDNGSTASGKNTKTKEVDGVALPMDGRQFKGMSKSEHLALDGSPFPRIPFGTLVEITVGNTVYTPKDGIVDIGPGKRPHVPVALDLTILAAQHFTSLPLSKIATQFETSGSFRIIGAAQYVKD